ALAPPRAGAAASARARQLSRARGQFLEGAAGSSRARQAPPGRGKLLQDAASSSKTRQASPGRGKLLQDAASVSGAVLSAPAILEIPWVFCGKTGHLPASETPRGASLQWGVAMRNRTFETPSQGAAGSSGCLRSILPKTSSSTTTAPTRAPQKILRPVASASGSGLRPRSGPRAIS